MWRNVLWMIFGALVASVIGGVMAQQQSPGVVPGCIYNATPPTLATGQSSVLQCDVNGRLRVTTS